MIKDKIIEKNIHELTLENLESIVKTQRLSSRLPMITNKN